MSEPERFLAWDAPTLERAAEHGCLDENVETGDPVVCGACCDLATTEGGE